MEGSFLFSSILAFQNKAAKKCQACLWARVHESIRSTAGLLSRTPVNITVPYQGWHSEDRNFLENMQVMRMEDW